MKLVDANIVLRYVLDDHPQLSSKATDILQNNEILLPFEVVCEIVYVLQKVYHVPRDEIQQTLNELLESGTITTEKPEVFRKALELHRSKNFDIVDAFLCAYCRVESLHVFTFDEKLQRCLDMETSAS
jgi:predicted nucleic-acid-binding protein